MSRPLPARPHLRHLRNEAKKLLKTLESGDAESAARVAAHLPRLTDADPDTVRGAEVSLQEVQHVLAKEYGHPTWESLSAAVEAVSRPDPDLEPLRRPLETLSLDEARRACHGLSRFIKEYGDSVSVIPPGDFYRAIEALGNQAAPSVGEFVRLVADGTMPETIAQMARQRGDTVARNLEVRRRLMLEAALAMRRGEPAQLLAHRLDTLGHAEHAGALVPNPARQPVEGTVEQLRQRLTESPVSTLPQADLGRVLVGLATIAESDGTAALAAIVGEIDEDYLRDALQMVVDQVDTERMVADLEPRLQAEVEQARLPFAPFGAGLAAALNGRTGGDLDAAVDAADAARQRGAPASATGS